MNEKPKIAILGVGAVGGSVGGWIASTYEHVAFLGRGEISKTLKSKGLILYKGDEPDNRRQIVVNVANDVDGISDADVIVLAVKTYSLDAAAKAIKEKIGDKPIIVAMQNGVENQHILPKYFSKVIYCIVCYNAWLDEPGVIGYQKKGPLVLGTPDNSLFSEMNDIAGIFNRGVETVVTPRLQDAAHSKMVINLANSLTTLIGHPHKKISSIGIFQKLLTNLTYEGVRIVRAAGHKECKLGGMPSWALMMAGAKLPSFLTRSLFKKNVAKMVISSMAQDILQKKGAESELETLNGHILRMAREHGIQTPYNTTVYELCKQEFAKPEFLPLDVKTVWKHVQKRL